MPLDEKDGVYQGSEGLKGTYSNDRSTDEEKNVKHVRLSQSKGSDDPFGDEENADIKYKTMAWWQAGMIMIAETISLGILSLPSVLAEIGMVGGIILILGLGVVATYTGYVLGQFKLAYPGVHNMADAGEVMLGPIGREIFGAAQMLFIVFLMGSHILTFTIMMNTITGHASCSIVFGIVGLAVSLICTLPRTLHKVSHMAIASFISIIAAVLITMIGVGIEKPGHNKVDPTVVTPFSKAFLATTNIVFAYAGHVAFFSFISEMKEPETYMKALYLLQGSDVSMYLIAAVVTYRYAGADVASPALGSTSGILPKLAYGIAIPTIVIAGVINGHVAAKYVYVRLFRGTDKMSKKTWGAFARWAMIVLLLWTLAWIIAEAIPVFNDLLGLISALFASWFTYGLSGVFWLFLNYGRYGESKKKMALTALNVCTFFIGLIVCVLGLYASGTAISENAKSSNGSFSCADNSKSEA
ncbi:MAG: hypothetical protein Q9166_002141 [cf. Caloplaca sp. 2 TL-2023]